MSDNVKNLRAMKRLVFKEPDSGLSVDCGYVLDSAAEEIERLRAALEWIADGRNWDRHDLSQVLDKAREALGDE